ncbi:MAG: inner membrane CreD family protein [Bacteroidetes bacterium]|nr:inner membrane CreD family protein [Bacteroidota bacterium]
MDLRQSGSARTESKLSSGVWDDETYSTQLKESAFGVDLVSTFADDYQKIMRTVKYAILTIGLTFLVFFW